MFRRVSALLVVLLLSASLLAVCSADNIEESIFDEAMLVTVAELGVKASQGTLFSVKKVGQIVAVKRYVADGGLHKVSIWETDVDASQGNAVLLAGIYDWTVEETGWQRFDLPEPVDVVPGKFYLVHISTSVSVEPESSIRFSAVQGYLSNRNSGLSSIITYGHSSRQYNAGDGTAYPGLGNTMWDFCVDVVFKAGASPTLGEVPYILPPEIVPSIAKNGGGAWNYGTEFQVAAKGAITKIRSYFQKGDSGKVYACIWNKDTGERLIGKIEWEIGTVDENGWREYELDTPVNVLPGTNYVVSVSACTEGNNKNDFVFCDYMIGDDYVYNTETYKNVYGVFSQDPNSMPDTKSLEGKRTFLRDVVFEPEIEENPETQDGSFSVIVLLTAAFLAAAIFKKSAGCKRC
jgi:hypothetical protein